MFFGAKADGRAAIWMLITVYTFQGFDETIQGKVFTRSFHTNNGQIRTEIPLLCNLGCPFSKSFLIVFKKFFGTSENAVKTQIWIAISTYVLVAIMKKRLKTDLTLYNILQIISISLFEKKPIY